MFNLSIITGLELCEKLIAGAQREVRRFASRSQSLENRSTDSTERVGNFADDIAETQNDLASTNAIIAGLPDGNRKKAEIAKRMELETRLYKLNLQAEKLTPEGAVEQQFEKLLADACLEVAQNYLAALLARKAELSPAAPPAPPAT